MTRDQAGGTVPTATSAPAEVATPAPGAAATPGTAAPAEAAATSQVGPRELKHGVGVGYARTQQGAVAAAANYTSVLSSDLILDEAKRRAAIDTLAAPEARAGMQKTFDRRRAAGHRRPLAPDRSSRAGQQDQRVQGVHLCTRTVGVP